MGEGGIDVIWFLFLGCKLIVGWGSSEVFCCGFGEECMCEVGV